MFQGWAIFHIDRSYFRFQDKNGFSKVVTSRLFHQLFLGVVTLKSIVKYPFNFTHFQILKNIFLNSKLRC